MTHLAYQKILCKKIKKWQKRQSRPLSDDLLAAALMLLSLNLDPIRADLQILYAHTSRGRPAYDPISMLRAFLLMTMLQYSSISKFVKEMRCKSRLAIIAGFQPHQVPAVGTFYLFIDRLENGPFQPHCSHRVLPAQQRKGRLLRNLKQERANKKEATKQLLAQCDTITENLQAQLLRADNLPRPNDFQKRLEDLLIKTVVITSAHKGLLGELNRLIICGDGSALPTGANDEGKPSCNCRQQALFECDHARFYADPTADWGHDAYRDVYYFGHHFYQHCVSSNGHDLPVHITIGPASASDFTLSMKSLDRFRKACAENQLSVSIYAAAYDGGHDALGNYKYLIAQHIKPVISINSRTGQHPNPTATAQKLNGEGIPLCVAGLPMRLHTKDHRTHRIYFNCPVKRRSYPNGQVVWNAYPSECPLGVLCQPDTKMGPVVYLRSHKDPRYYPEIARNSQQYQQIYNLRTGCERSNSLKKVTYKLERRPCRCAAHYLMRLYLISIVEHAKAWLAENKKIVGNNWRKLIAISAPTPSVQAT